MRLIALSLLGVLGCESLLAGCSVRDTSPSTSPSSTNTASTLKDAGAVRLADAGTPKAIDPSPFHLAAESGKAFQVYTLENATFVHSGSFVGRLEKDKIVYDATVLRGLGLTGEDMSTAFLERMFGAWPNEAWALQRGSTGRVGYSKALRWEKDRWVSKMGTAAGKVIGDVLRDERGFVGVWYEQMTSGYGLTQLSGRRPVAPAPQLTAAERKACQQRHASARLTVRTVIAGPDKSVYALGGWDPCAPEYEEGAKHFSGNVRWVATVPVVDRWAAATNSWKKIALPLADGTSPDSGFGASAATASGLYVAYGESLFFVSGDKVNKIDLPTEATGAPKALVVLSSGELMMADPSGSIFQFAIGGKARRIPLPPIGKSEAHAFRITRLADDDLLVAAGDRITEDAFDQNDALDGGQEYALFRTRPMAAYDVSQEFAEKAALSEEPPRAFGTGYCKRPLVLLYEVPNSTAADFGFDTTAKAIAADAALQAYDYLDFRYGGKRYLGARLQLESDKPGEFVDYELRGKPLIKTVETGVAGSHPKLVCHAPRATRVLKFDGSTKKFEAGANVRSGP